LPFRKFASRITSRRLSRPFVGFADASRFLRVRTCPIKALAGSSRTNVAPATSGSNLLPRRREFRRRRRQQGAQASGPQRWRALDVHSEMVLALPRLTRESKLVREVRTAATMPQLLQNANVASAAMLAAMSHMVMVGLQTSPFATAATC
jgi:hypothetical protein